MKETTATVFEDDKQRADRRRRRIGFDAVADLYDAVRPAYPRSLIDRIFDLSGVDTDSRILEVGCGTGQLTQDLAIDGIHVVAIDPGAALISLARRRVPNAEFLITTFEDFPINNGPFDLVISASAFHWTDPDIRWQRSAVLLKRDGWLMIIDTILEHEEPLAATIRQLWIDHSSDSGAWATNPPPPLADQLEGSGLFGPPVKEVHATPTELPVDAVVALAQTSAAYLAYDETRQASFTSGLIGALAGRDRVNVSLGASLLAARRS